MNLEDLILEEQQECEKAMSRCSRGAWSTEPHRVEFKHAGFDCLLRRVSSHLQWCGYVALPKNHPYFGHSYDEMDNLDVHGGITYADKCEKSVCHRNEDPDDDVWWVGFDCGHGCDYSPAYSHLLTNFRDTGMHYWTVEEVKEETQKLAEQLKNLGENGE